MEQRERLIEIIQNSVGGCARNWAEVIADGLIADGWMRPPCIERTRRLEAEIERLEELVDKLKSHSFKVIDKPVKEMTEENNGQL